MHPSTPNYLLAHLSQRLLQAVRNQAAEQLIPEQESISLNTLLAYLENDVAKKTFWINMYNAWFQWLVLQAVPRKSIFTHALIPFADIRLSLDDIEHGILRRHRWKYGLGYLPLVFCPRHIKRLAVEEVDHRIHFALNCGAVSCPPIAIYDFHRLNDQLDVATRQFMMSETTVEEESKTLRTTRLLAWFRGDFRKAGGPRRFLEQLFDRDFRGFTIAYNAYSWDEKLMHFAAPNENE
jgi:hypothetical protein